MPNIEPKRDAILKMWVDHMGMASDDAVKMVDGTDDEAELLRLKSHQLLRHSTCNTDYLDSKEHLRQIIDGRRTPIIFVNEEAQIIYRVGFGFDDEVPSHAVRYIEVHPNSQVFTTAYHTPSKSEVGKTYAQRYLRFPYDDCDENWPAKLPEFARVIERNKQ